LGQVVKGIGQLLSANGWEEYVSKLIIKASGVLNSAICVLG